MFEKFTERGRQVVVLAQDEARRGRNPKIGRPHLLAGLLREEEGIAARVLGAFDPPVTLEAVRLTYPEPLVEAVVGQIPFTPGAKQALEDSQREALRLGHNYIGTEHVLLGLARGGPMLDRAAGGRSLEEVEAAVVRELMRRPQDPLPISEEGRRLEPTLSLTIDRAADLVKDLVSEGRQASLTVYGPPDNRGESKEVRVNVLYDSFEFGDMSHLDLAGRAHGFGLEFSKAHGATLRPAVEVRSGAAFTITATGESSTTNTGEPGGPS